MYVNSCCCNLETEYLQKLGCIGYERGELGFRFQAVLMVLECPELLVAKKTAVLRSLPSSLFPGLTKGWFCLCAVPSTFAFFFFFKVVYSFQVSFIHVNFPG